MIIVTHNMQQVLRVSNLNAYFNAVGCDERDGKDYLLSRSKPLQIKYLIHLKKNVYEEYMSGKFG